MGREIGCVYILVTSQRQPCMIKHLRYIDSILGTALYNMSLQRSRRYGRLGRAESEQSASMRSVCRLESLRYFVIRSEHVCSMPMDYKCEIGSYCR